MSKKNKRNSFNSSEGQDSTSSSYLQFPRFDKDLESAARLDPAFMDELNAIGQQIEEYDLPVDHAARKIDFFHLQDGGIVKPTDTLRRHFQNGDIIDGEVIWRIFGQDEPEYRPTFPSSRERRKREDNEARAKRSAKKSLKKTDSCR
jgi:hypothetical protein